MGWGQMQSSLPSPTVITDPGKIADLIWLSELGGVRRLFQGAFEVNKIDNFVFHRLAWEMGASRR